MLRKILIVDDSELVRQGLVLLLGHYRGTRILTAGDGAAALEQMRADPEIDLVLLDVSMPVMGGVATLTRIQKDGLPREIPVIVMASAAEEASARQCLALGAKASLTKPVKARDLQALIDTLAGGPG